MNHLRPLSFSSQRLSSVSRHLSYRPPTSTFARAMATTEAPKKHEWLVILPDNEGALAKRMEVRPKHLEGAAAGARSGFLLFGGAFFSEIPKEGQSPPPIIGSALLAYAESKEAVLEELKKDIYSQNDVWDWDKVQIYPFKSALRQPL